MDKTLPKYRLFIIFFTVFVLLVLYLQAMIFLWRGHMELDVYAFFVKIKGFLDFGSFFPLKNNEYFPGSLLFFFSPLIFCWQKLDYLSYLNGFFLINLFLIGIHVWIFHKYSNSMSTLLFLLIMLVSGPILLFRFELFISLLVILSIILWQKNNYALATLILGLAITVKVYPIIILPYMLLILARNKQYRLGLRCLLTFLIGILVPIEIFFLLGGNLQQIAVSLEFHSAKPVSIESLPGVILTATSLVIDKKPPTLLGGYGVWGIKTAIVGFSPIIFNWLWVLPVALFYGYLISHKENKKLKAGVVFWLTLLFLMFSKNLHPQYIFWFITLFPLLKTKLENNLEYLVLFSLIMVIVLLNQYVYPLLYTQFIQNFYFSGSMGEIFYLQLLRNVGIVSLAIISFKNIFIDKTIE